jgi:hypothetical protein
MCSDRDRRRVSSLDSIHCQQLLKTNRHGGYNIRSFYDFPCLLVLCGLSPTVYPVPSPPHPPRRRQRGRSVLVLLLLLLLWSFGIGLGLAQAAEPWFGKAPEAPEIAALPEMGADSPAPVGTVDVVSDRQQAGQTLYLQTCATCHLAIPPAVFPSETWRQLLLDPQHYGVTLTPLQNPNLRLVWDYLKTYSRPEAIGEAIPYRVYQSRYFQILHPKVKLPTRAGLSTCLSCHPGAGTYDFRRVSAEWQNAP